MSLTRIQCLEDAQKNYEIGTEISLKNSVRSLEDFIKVASNELGKYKLIYEIIKEQDIRKTWLDLDDSGPRS